MSPLINKKVSVCLLTYNHANTIESTLKSILAQKFTDFEIIVSDDCSSDGTWEKILEIAALDSRIRPVRTSHNLGMPGNANHAVLHSVGEHVAILHHDDLYREDMLDEWSRVMQAFPDVGFVFNSYGVFSSSFVYSENIPYGSIDGTVFLKKYLFPRWGCPVRGTAMIRRSVWDALGGMNERYGLLADIDLWMRIAQNWDVGYVPEPLITVRHQRPEYYPDIYRGSNKSFWRRLKFLYEIHADNRREFYKEPTFMNWAKKMFFVLKLNFESGKWLVYSLLKNKQEYIRYSNDAAMSYDCFVLRAFRNILLRVYCFK